MSSDQSRKVLEDIQRQKSKLLKDGAAASLGISVASSSSSAVQSLSPYASPSGGLSPASNNDVHMSPAMRSAMLVLQQANSSSFGYFVAQDSHFGNSILPVLPRLDPNGTPIAGIPGMVSSPLGGGLVKAEK